MRDRRAFAEAACGHSDSRPLQSSPESGQCAGYDGHKPHRGSTAHLAVDTLGQLLAAVVTPAGVQDRAQLEALARQVHAATGDTVAVAFADQGDTGPQAAAAAQPHGVRLEVVRLPTAKHGVVLRPRRWVLERCFAWMARFRRLARDDERLAERLASLYVVAFALLPQRFITLMTHSAS